MYIYKITNSKTGKFYIGKTTSDIQRRWYHHKRNALIENKPFHLSRAIRKDGSDSFSIELIETVENYRLLNEREQFWIDTLQPDYNMTKGGDGGWTHNQTGNRWKVKDSSRMGRVFKSGYQSRYIDYTKISGANNYQSKHRIHTPWGVFDTWQEAIALAKELRSDYNRRDVITDVTTLRKYCTENILLNAEGRRTYPEWRGKYTNDIGFYLEEKWQQ